MFGIIRIRYLIATVHRSQAVLRKKTNILKLLLGLALLKYLISWNNNEFDHQPPSQPDSGQLTRTCARLVESIPTHAHYSLRERCDYLEHSMKQLEQDEANLTLPADAIAGAANATAGGGLMKRLLQLDLRKMVLAKHIQELQYFVYSNLMQMVKPQDYKVHNEPDIVSLREITATLENQILNSRGQAERTRLTENAENFLQSTVDTLQTTSGKRALICSADSIYTGGYTYFIEVVTWCLSAALSTGRQLVLHHPEKFYLKSEYVQPINEVEFGKDRTLEELKNKYKAWPFSKQDHFEFTHVYYMFDRFKNQKIMDAHIPMPPRIPKYLDPLYKVMPEEGPLAWYVGQLSRRLLRSSPGTKLEHEARLKHFKVDASDRPMAEKTAITASIHVRRGNKVSERECPAQPLWKYMTVVEDQYRKHEYRLGRKLERRVFVFTEDIAVLDEAHKEYPHYTILANRSTVENALGNQSHCYNYEKKGFDLIRSIYLDVLMMAETDFHVCTFSSNVCRLVYGLRAARNTDATRTTFSLDLDWYFERQLRSWKMTALQSHVGPKHPYPDAPGAPAGHQLEFKPGDIIYSSHRFRLMKEPWAWDYLAQKFPDGLAFGINHNHTVRDGTTLADRTLGIYPRYKVSGVRSHP